MYSSVKSRVKQYSKLSDTFDCMIGVRQGECLSSFLFSMFLNDIESVFYEKGLDGIDIDSLKIFFGVAV